jgi:hypothetical protein
MTSQLGDPVAPPVVKETAGPAAKREKGLRRLLALGRGIGRTRRQGAVTNGGPVRPEPASTGAQPEPASTGAQPAREAPASEGASAAGAGRGDSSGPPPGDVLGWTHDPRRRSGRRGAGRTGRASAQGSGTSARRGRGQRPGGQQAGGQQAGAWQAGGKGGETGAGRQRKLSARATAERALAAQEAAARRRSAAAAAAELLWTRVPEKPTRYRLLTRLSDMRHGWLDGRSGLPRLPEFPKLTSAVEPAAPFQPAAAMPLPSYAPAPAPVPAITGPPSAAESSLVTAVPATPPAWLQTPRMVLLGRRALELARAEEQACVADCAAYRNGISQFRKLRDAAEEDLNQARATLALAKHPLTEHELSTRRLAEQSTQDRPESFVRGRRQAEWDRRLAAATQAVQAATARLADATREAELREALIRDRVAVARAAALRHHEFHMRRIATYLQQLVRTHKQGADLNMLLMRYPVGPGLPEWTRDTHASDGASSP